MKLVKSEVPRNMRRNLDTGDWWKLSSQGLKRGDVVFKDMFGAGPYLDEMQLSHLEYFVFENRTTVFVVPVGRNWECWASFWLAEGPSRINDNNEAETACILADLCVLRYNLKGESE